ncbi:MAG: formylglycine-generating enzyme family protein [Blastocatellia bacterium]
MVSTRAACAPRRFACWGLILAFLSTVVSCSSPPKTVQVTDAHAHHQAEAKTPDAASAAQAHVNTTPPPGPAPEGMVWVPGGTFWMGCDDCEMPDAEPVHLVTLDGYWIDKTPVTNAEFEKFVQATGYKTIAERTPKAEDYPGAKPEMLVAGSIVFNKPKQAVPLDNAYIWWKYEPGADWRHPQGAKSDIKSKANHPVVHIAWLDAVEYAKWAGKRLPTEAEFEFAARGGLDRNKFAWGNDLKPNGKWAANIWQGHFPDADSGEDGYKTVTSPVMAFPPNGFGLYDVGGNVWQWCADWYRPDYFAQSDPKTPVKNPQGPSDSYDPQEPGIQKRVQKSGSLMCSDQYCARYHVGSRGKGAIDSGASHIGFRCVKAAS